MATVLAPAYGSPFVRDLDGGRRYGTIEDFRNFVKLAYSTPFLHHSGGTVCEPVDLPVNKRHYDMVYAHMKYSDKPFMGSVTHPLRARDTVDMARILFGADALEERTYILSLCNANSPLVWDSIMLGAAKAYAEANQAVIMTPFILAGAMSPATVGGRRHADARRGAGRHGLRAARAARRAGRVRVVRVVDVDAVGRADLRDARAGAGAVRAGGVRPTAGRAVPQRRVAHRVQDRRRPGRLREREHPAADDPRRRELRAARRRAGWRAAWRWATRSSCSTSTSAARCTSSPRAWICRRTARRSTRSSRTSPGTHFLGTAHTLANFETAFYRSNTADNNSFEQWELDGSLDAAQRANAIWKKTLAEYEAPPLDEAKDEELRAWIDRKKASFPDSNA